MLNLEVLIFYPNTADWTGNLGQSCNDSSKNYIGVKVFTQLNNLFGVDSTEWNNTTVTCTTIQANNELAQQLNIVKTPTILFVDTDRSMVLKKLEGSFNITSLRIKQTLKFLHGLTAIEGESGYVTQNGGGFNPLAGEGGGGVGLPLLPFRNLFPDFPASFKWIFGAMAAYSGYKYKKGKSKILWGSVTAYSALNLIAGQE